MVKMRLKCSGAIILNHTISGGGLGTLCKTKEGSTALVPVYVTCAKSLSCLPVKQPTKWLCPSVWAQRRLMPINCKIGNKTVAGDIWQKLVGYSVREQLKIVTL